jgi:hypothetical protein
LESEDNRYFRLLAQIFFVIDDFGHLPRVNVINGGKIREYYEYLDRQGWTNNDLGVIDWEAISLLLNATPHTKRMKILQLQHRWQNTGHQKLQFLEATGETITEELKKDHDVCCAFNWGEQE